MAAFGNEYWMGGTYSPAPVWWASTTSATTFPIYIQPTPPSDWEKAAVKAEPDDEFTWLRKRVREVEEMAFA